MCESTDTLENQNDVPRQTRLHRRGSKYYFRARVPVDLQKAMGKREIKYSLKTSDYDAARKMVPFESLKADELFEKERFKLLNGKDSQVNQKKKVSVLSEHSVVRLVTRWFLEQEEAFSDWYEEEGIDLGEEEKEEVLETLGGDIAGYKGAYLQKGEVLDFGESFNALLKDEDIEIEPDSELYKKLNGLFRKGSLELAKRQFDWMTKEKMRRYDDVFWRYVQPNLAKQRKEQITLGQLCERFMRDKRKSERTKVTLRAYTVHAAVMREVLGEKTLIHDITRENIVELADFIKLIPSNAKKKFPNKSLSRIVELTKNKKEIARISPRTASNYYTSVLALFAYALETELIEKNPANDRWIKDSFKYTNLKKKDVFSAEELNKLFHAPLYTGCLDDERGYAKVGSKIIKRGRFWIPLICLFQGMRMNEACQLYSEDVQEKEGRPCLLIREEDEEGQATEKRLKNKASRREIPLHPMLLKMGFSDFVRKRKKDQASRRLFPDIKAPHGKDEENYSATFSKWFARFVVSALDYKPKANFHSFRHMFRDRLRAAEIGIEMSEALGGWTHGNKSSEAGYGQGFAMNQKYEALSKIEYPDLDLSHLYEK